jgi:hypothetical protein
MTGSARKHIDDPAAWLGPQIQHDDDWIYHLNEQQIAEIDAALRQVKRAGLAIPFTAAQFPLPTLAAALAQILDEIENGRGFMLVRGFPRSRYSDADCELVYWGLGMHFGKPVSQNARGHLLGHVRDEGGSIADPNTRAYQTNMRMDFHTDLLPVDLLGLFCLRTAKSGGASKLVSALAVHNILLDERPDLLEELYGRFHLDWRGEEPSGEQPWFTLPMFSESRGRITTRICSIPYYDSAARFGEVYRPSARQREALVLVQDIANRPETMLTMEFQEGDMQLINNHIMLHAREAYVDHDEPGRERHLLRMWIAVDDAHRRPLAPAVEQRYRWVREGGIPVNAAHKPAHAAAGR